jgi:high-affinity nickel-transport protein
LSFLRHNKHRQAVTWLYVGLTATNLAAWAYAYLMFRGHPLLLETALLAYALGLRHGVDADHVVAIDNVTRQLLQAGEKPLTTGLFFALGHSSVVFLASAAIALGAQPAFHALAHLRGVGDLLGGGMSAIFLFVIAVANLSVLLSLTRAFRKMRDGANHNLEDQRAGGLAGFNLLRLVLGRALTLIRSSWQMYPLGFLLGLGFDTASEIAVLGISAAASTQGMSPGATLVFPLLFAAGMTLIDTTDSIVMTGIYGWAFVAPQKKLRYNITITLVSVLVAFATGGIELLGLISSYFHLDRGAWAVVAQLNEHFVALGLAVAAIFASVWIVSVAMLAMSEPSSKREVPGS